MLVGERSTFLYKLKTGFIALLGIILFLSGCHIDQGSWKQKVLEDRMARCCIGPFSRLAWTYLKLPVSPDLIHPLWEAEF